MTLQRQQGRPMALTPWQLDAHRMRGCFCTQCMAAKVPHTHHCPECCEAWTCRDVDCEPAEAEKLCHQCP
jgi:hypothetical protein